MTFELGPREKWLADQDYKRFKRSWYTRVAVGVITILLLLTVARMADACQILFSRANKTDFEFKAWVGESVAGRIIYRVQPDNELIIPGMFVAREFRRQGISDKLAAHVIEMMPKTKVISGLLVMDNLAASGLLGHTEPVYMPECMEAAQKTPFYRSWSKLGFTQFLKCYYSHETSFFEVSLVRS